MALDRPPGSRAGVRVYVPFPYCWSSNCFMRASCSVQSITRRLPSPSAITIISPAGVGRRSISRSSFSRGIGGEPQMLFGISMPGTPCGRRLAVEIGGGDLAVPVARRAHARPLGDQRCELGIAREMIVDGDDVGAEIEYALHARHDCRQRFYIREADGDGHRVAFGQVSH